MKKVSFLLFAVFMFVTIAATAQQVNADSLKLVAQISDNQYKLGKLQNMVDQKIKNKQNAADNAQASADNNVTAAKKLTDDPDNKALARNADNKAGDAKSDAKKSRKETQRLDNLNKQIMDLKGKIASQQAKLNTYYVAAPGTKAWAPAPVPADSTQHP